MKIPDKKLIEILLAQSYIDSADAETAIQFSERYEDTTAVEYLITNNIINKDLMGQAVAESFGVRYSDLNSKKPTTEQVLSIPEDLAVRYRIVVFQENDNGIVIATDNPQQEGLMRVVSWVFPDRPILITFSLGEDMDEIFIQYRKELKERFDIILEKAEHLAPQLLNEIFADAHIYHASDIHFEPQGNEVLIRFRVDGILREVGRLPRVIYEKIVNKIKVESHLKIDDHFSTQDGSMQYKSGKVRFDLRTSIVPTIEGEKIVLRVLESYNKGITFANLGLSRKNQIILEKIARKPFGMILVTGPTGSGKTTTLYSILRLLHRPEVNITTIEDPVEYKVTGINQIQVNKQTGLTFSKGLRSVVRQDPDVILVGEIRDNETSEIAINAALTGHLLLSTFHANNAAIAIPRLFDMNIEPFLLASTIDVVIAQRLVRKICETCRYSVKMTEAQVLEKYGDDGKYLGKGDVTLYAGKGCHACNDTGYHGRIAIFEFIHITPELQDLILTRPSSKQIWSLAKGQGSESLFEDGVKRVLSGITTLEELLRNIAPPKMG